MAVASYLRDEHLEQRDDLYDMVKELNQSWDDRLDCPPTELSERYLRGRLSVLIELSFEFGTELERAACCAEMAQELPREERRSSPSVSPVPLMMTSSLCLSVMSIFWITAVRLKFREAILIR